MTETQEVVKSIRFCDLFLYFDSFQEVGIMVLFIINIYGNFYPLIIFTINNAILTRMVVGIYYFCKNDEIMTKGLDIHRTKIIQATVD